jgi:gas vesicle protein
MNKILTIVGAIALSLLIFSSASSANAAFFSGKDLITPDSSFSFLQTWKESIQTFFTFGLENKAKQYLHLADVRLNEYKNLLEQGKTDIAQKTLDKYKKQLNQALGKAEELKGKGMDVKDLSQKIEETVSRHLEVLQENLQKVPEQAKKGLENAIENSQKQVEKILEKKIEKQNETAKPVPSEVEGLSPELVEGWKTYRNEEYGFEVRYPKDWAFDEESSGAKFYKGSIYGANLDGAEVYISYQANTEKFTLENWIINVKRPADIKEYLNLNDVKVVKLSGVMYKETQALIPIENSAEIKLLVIKDNTRFELIGVVVGHNYRNDLEITDQILSTFKFIK